MPSQHKPGKDCTDEAWRQAPRGDIDTIGVKVSAEMIVFNIDQKIKYFTRLTIIKTNTSID